MNTCNPNVRELLNTKAVIKQEVFRKSKAYFKTLKKVVSAVADNLSDETCNLNESVEIEYKEEGTFECELRFSGDILLFNMHTNIFTFDKGHPIWNTGYIKQDKSRAYFSVINIYNFLADSMRYNRKADEGVLLGRIFVNREGHYFVEGKRQLSFMYNNLAGQTISDESLKNIVDTAIIYSLEFDLTVPEYKDVMRVSVGQIQAMSDEIQIKTAKKIGMGYYTRMTHE